MATTNSRFPSNIGTTAKCVSTPEDGAVLLLAAMFGREASPPEWHDEAACRDAPDEAWFPEPGDFTAPRKQQELREQYCDRCPVLEQCREDAFEWDMKSYSNGRDTVIGLAGGMLARERRDLVKRHRDASEETA